MINCPKCNATLPDSAGRCQFCGAALAKLAPRRSQDDGEETNYSVPLKWVWPAYYAIAG